MGKINLIVFNSDNSVIYPVSVSDGVVVHLNTLKWDRWKTLSDSLNIDSLDFGTIIKSYDGTNIFNANEWTPCNGDIVSIRGEVHTLPIVENSYIHLLPGFLIVSANRVISFSIDNAIVVEEPDGTIENNIINDPDDNRQYLYLTITANYLNGQVRQLYRNSAFAAVAPTEAQKIQLGKFQIGTTRTISYTIDSVTSTHSALPIYYYFNEWETINPNAITMSYYLYNSYISRENTAFLYNDYREISPVYMRSYKSTMSYDSGNVSTSNAESIKYSTLDSGYYSIWNSLTTPDLCNDLIFDNKYVYGIFNNSGLYYITTNLTGTWTLLSNLTNIRILYKYNNNVYAYATNGDIYLITSSNNNPPTINKVNTTVILENSGTYKVNYHKNTIVLTYIPDNNYQASVWTSTNGTTFLKISINSTTTSSSRASTERFATDGDKCFIFLYGINLLYVSKDAINWVSAENNYNYGDCHIVYMKGYLFALINNNITLVYDGNGWQECNSKYYTWNNSTSQWVKVDDEKPQNACGTISIIDKDDGTYEYYTLDNNMTSSDTYNKMYKLDVTII